MLRKKGNMLFTETYWLWISLVFMGILFFLAKKYGFFDQTAFDRLLGR